MTLTAATMAGCATRPPASDPEAVAEYAAVNDPLEPMNRAIFAFNRMLDDAVLKPVSRAYRDGVPVAVRSRVGGLLDHLRAPLDLLNDLLQGEFDRALGTLARFTVNTTVGLFGLHDMAGAMGMEDHDEDFGQTLAVWGVDDGPYLMLPILGPSNPRDAVGLAVDFLADPFNLWAGNVDRMEYVWARTGTRAVHGRAEILELTDDLEKSSLDYYAAVRSLYRQRRANAISNGDGAANRPAPSMGGLPDGPRLEPKDEISLVR